MRQLRSAQELAAVVLRSRKLGRNNVQYGYTRMNDCRTRNVTAFAHFPREDTLFNMAFLKDGYSRGEDLVFEDPTSSGQLRPLKKS